MVGKFVSYSAPVMRISHDDRPDSEYYVSATVTVTLNGRTARMSDLQPGDRVVLLGDPAVTVTAERD
jgi:hypothetical protein